MMVGRQLADIYPARDRRPARWCSPCAGLSRPGVLHDIDLDIRAGEILGICGMAGSGRTELLRALIGADRRDARDLSACDGSRAPRRPARARRSAAGIVLLPEDRKTEGCFLPQSVAFNITISRLAALRRNGLLSEAPRARRRRRAGPPARHPHARHRDAPIRKLSGGNQQKCLIARSLNAGCAILLIDEPTRGVDVGAKREIYQLLADLADERAARRSSWSPPSCPKFSASATASSSCATAASPAASSRGEATEEIADGGRGRRAETTWRRERRR